MPRHDFEFEIDETGDVRMISIAKGYDHAINLSINHDTNWWLTLIRTGDGDYIVDVQVGNHNTVLLDADRDGLRGVDEDRLEVTAKGRYRVDLLTRALGYVQEYETRIIYAMEALYQDSKAVAA